MTAFYDRKFFGSINAGSRRSAEIVFGQLEALFQDKDASLVDVGCGTGTWAAVFADKFQTSAILGIDGDYVDRSELAIAESAFLAHDLARPLVTGKRFTLAISLEVAEHLPPSAAPVLLDTLTDLSNWVLFSAAIPGQGGEYHVNERPLEYWRSLFRRQGFLPVDCIRPALHRNRNVEPWYRYNTILYVKEESLKELPKEFRQWIVADHEMLPNYSSLWWKIRCAIIARLPASLVLQLARMKRRGLFPTLVQR